MGLGEELRANAALLTLVSNRTASPVFECSGRDGARALLKNTSHVDETCQDKFPELWDPFLNEQEKQDAEFV